MLYLKEHIQAYEIQIEAEAGFSEAIWCSLKTQGSRMCLAPDWIVAERQLRVQVLSTNTDIIIFVEAINNRGWLYMHNHMKYQNIITDFK